MRLLAQADSDETIFTGRLSLASHPWLADHKVHGVVLVPGAAMVELALRAVTVWGSRGWINSCCRLR